MRHLIAILTLVAISVVACTSPPAVTHQQYERQAEEVHPTPAPTPHSSCSKHGNAISTNLDTTGMTNKLWITCHDGTVFLKYSDGEVDEL